MIEQAHGRQWGILRIPARFFCEQPEILASGLSHFQIESMIYDGETDAFIIVASAPFLDYVADGDEPVEYMLNFFIMREPGGRILVAVRADKL